MLIGKEAVFMDILWDCRKPMTSMGILEAAPAGAWENKNDKNIHRIIRQLLKKNMIKICGQMQSGTQYARLFEPTVTREEYIVNLMSSYDVDSLIKIAIGLIKAAMKKVDREKVSNELIEELEEAVRRLRKKNEDSGKVKNELIEELGEAVRELRQKNEDGDEAEKDKR